MRVNNYLVKALMRGLAITALLFSVTQLTKADEMEALRINPSVCSKVEDNTLVLVQLMQMNFTPEQIKARAAIGMEDTVLEDDSYLAWYMSGTAREFIKSQMVDPDIVKLHKSHPNYTRAEIVGKRAKQLCMVNEGTLYSVPKRN